MELDRSPLDSCPGYCELRGLGCVNTGQTTLVTDSWVHLTRDTTYCHHEILAIFACPDTDGLTILTRDTDELTLRPVIATAGR